MEMRHCNKCNQTKEVGCFSRRGNGYQPWCKECVKEHSRKRYLDRKSEYLERNKQAHKRSVAFITRMKRRFGCQLCGYKKSLKALSFHHVDETQKEFLISATTKNGLSRQRLKEEMRKCVVLCANCHQEVHEGITILGD